jgi:CBS domain-containing protein
MRLDLRGGVMRTDLELHVLLGSVGEAMTKSVVTLSEDTMGGEAARILEHAGVSGAPVTREGNVVGVVTLKDLMTRVGASQVSPTGPFHRFEHLLAGIEVGEVMSRDVVKARAAWSLARAIDAMDRAGVNRLPVVDETGHPVGILTRDDVIRAVALRTRVDAQRDSDHARHVLVGSS